MKIRIIFFFNEIGTCSKKLTLMRIFRVPSPAPAPSLTAPLPHLAIKPIQLLCLQGSSPASPLVKKKITANSPTLMNSPEVTCQQTYLRWEMFLHLIYKEITF